jgi:putative tricarboxylic transport membrane protein
MSAKASSSSREGRDLVMGLLLLAFSVFFFILSYFFTGMDTDEQTTDVGPAFLPRRLLVAMVLESAWLIASSWLKKRAGQTSGPLPGLWQRRPLIMFAAFLIYIYLATLVGFIPSSIAFLLLSFFMLGVRRWWLLISLPPAVTLAVYHLFSTLLNVPLPTGSLF